MDKPIKEYDKINNVEVMNFDSVRCYQDDSNTLQYKTRDVARELGYERKFVRKDIVGNKSVPTCGHGCGSIEEKQPYIQDQVRWERINKNLNSLGFDSLTEEQKTGYIPENLVYKLGFHGRTQKAIEFQNLVSDKILPYYREHVNLEEHNRMKQELEETKKQLDIAIDEVIGHQRAADKYNKALGNMNQQRQFWHEKTEELAATRNNDQKTIEELEYKLNRYRTLARAAADELEDDNI